jgi:hypothetical protein
LAGWHEQESGAVREPGIAVVARVRAQQSAGGCTRQPGANQAGQSAAAFADLARYTLDRFLRWARRKHRRITVKAIRRRYCNGGWWPVTTETGLLNPAKVGTTRYRYRGAAIPAPWPASG